MASTNVGNAYVTVSARFDKSWSSGVLTKANAVGDLISKGISKAMGAVSSSLDAAISRVDTMNNFPRIMENMGIAGEAASASIKRLSDGIDGLPTALDTAVLGVERFTAKNGDIDKSTDYFLALNNAILAGGASSELQSAAVEQLAQSYSKGKMDMMEWRSIQQAMPAQLNQIAKAMGKTTDELGEGLRSGEVSMDEFMDAIVRLNKDGGEGLASFEEQARTATGGIGTALTNVQNRINKAVASIIDAVGQTNISGAINAFSASFKDFAKPVITMIESFKSSFDFSGFMANMSGFMATLQPFGKVFDNIAKAVGTTAAHLVELFGNVMTVGAPAFELLGGIISGAFMGALNVLDTVASGLNALFGEFDLMELGWERQTAAIGATGKELDIYVQTIEELAGQDELTAVEQEKLKQAVEGYNRITGDSVEITNAARGELSKSTEDIKNNAQAWLDNAYAQAYQQQVSDIIADTIKKQQELATATDELTLAEQQLDAARNNPALASQTEYMGKLEENVSNARAKVIGLTQGIDENNQKLEEAQGKATAADTSLVSYIDSNIKLKNVLKDAGSNSTKFANLLASLGKSEKDLANMSPNVVNGLANISKMGGSMGENVGKAFNNMMDFGEKSAKGIMSAFSPVPGDVTNKFSSARAGATTNLNATEAKAKSTATNSGNAFNPLPSKLNTLFTTAKNNASTALNSVVSKANSSSTSTGNAFNSVPGKIGANMEEARRNASSSLNGISSSSASSASNSVPPWHGLGDRIKSAIGNVSFPQPHVSFTWQNIAGISVPFPHVDWYKLGGFVDGATLIGAGEAGAEAILPQSGGLMDSFSENLTQHVNNADLIAWLEDNLAPIIETSAPTSTPRELRRINRKVAAYA